MAANYKYLATTSHRSTRWRLHLYYCKWRAIFMSKVFEQHRTGVFSRFFCAAADAAHLPGLGSIMLFLESG
jgi:hypothetical protein